VSEQRREALKREVVKRWPGWFGDDARALMIPVGWDRLVIDLCALVERSVSPAAAATFRVQVASEKFGALRFMWRLPREIGEDDHAVVNRLVAAAHEASKHVCQRCGEPGVHRGDTMPVETICARHQAEDQVLCDLMALGLLDAAGEAAATASLRQWWPGIVTDRSEIGIPNGWADIAVDVVGQLAATVPLGVRFQIQYFVYRRMTGRLFIIPRFGGSPPIDPDAKRAIHEAFETILRVGSARCLPTCEVCGIEADCTTFGWWPHTLCKPHLAEWMARYRVEERVAMRQLPTDVR
jgi:hypothetical protein